MPRPNGRAGSSPALGIMYLSHKIALDPNNNQATHFAKACGVSRFAYNWALNEWKLQYEARKIDPSLPTVTGFNLDKKLNSIKKEQFPWMMEVTKCAPQKAINQLEVAFKSFFKGTSRYPSFKKKGIRDSFELSNDQFNVSTKKIKLPKIGWVRLHEPLRFTGKLIKATVSRTANRWFVSITVEVPDSLLPPAENQSVGVDLGVTTLATLSNGEKFAGPRALNFSLKKLKRLSRSLSKKVKGSSNRKKAKGKLAKLHFRVANIRKDSLHKLTSYLSSSFSTIGIEDLNVKGMVKNMSLARAISDIGFYEFRRQLEYKTARRGSRLVVADPWFPSSKTCSTCSFKVESLPLSVRNWTCSSCHSQHDRDINASVNLRLLAESSPVIACGEISAGSKRKQRTKLASMKQEPTSTVV